MKIGPITLRNRVVLAPMAGVTDWPFRKIVSNYGPGLLCGEMISALAMHYQSQKTFDLVRIDPGQKPLSLQIFGSDPEVMAEAAKVIADKGADIIDINMGCPVPKVVKNGEGAALLNNLPLAARILEKVVRSVTVPVTLKCRLGWDEEHIVAPELARIAEAAGIAAIAVHGRTRNQFYQGDATWDWIATVKQQVKIPVIGNGDINSPQAAQAIIDRTKCDGVMIGQAALGRPWLFSQIVNYLGRGVLVPEPALKEKFRVIFEHLHLQVEFAGEERGLKEMRKHLLWYLKGWPDSARMREAINKQESLSSLLGLLRQYQDYLTNPEASGADPELQQIFDGKRSKEREHHEEDHQYQFGEFEQGPPG